MFSFPLAFILLVVPKFMFLKLHMFNHCLERSGSFCTFLYLRIFSKMKLLEKFQKNYIKNLYQKRGTGAPGADQGAPLVQETRWRGLAPDRATRAPFQVCVLPTSLPHSKNVEFVLGARVLAVLGGDFRSLSTAHY